MKQKNALHLLAHIFIIIVLIVLVIYSVSHFNMQISLKDRTMSSPSSGKGPEFPEALTPQKDQRPSCPEIKRIVLDSDKDKDGIKDADEILEGGRIQIELKPRYLSEYYKGGYPPPDIAVCTDIVCRALMHAGYDLKSMMDKDIAENIRNYPRVNGKPDPNIDFRRVRNMVPFFKKFAYSLTTDVKPYDVENLVEWQGGDLVVFYWTGIEHIAIVSDKRNGRGVPYLIHTYGSFPREDDRLFDWADTIVYHFRFPIIEGQ